MPGSIGALLPGYKLHLCGPLWCWLIANNADKLPRIRASRYWTRKRLIIVGVIGDGVVVGIGKRTNPVCFKLEIEIIKSKRIYILAT